MRINLFGLGLSSKSPYVTAKGMQNMYAETRPAGEKSMMVAYKTPGLDLFSDTGVNIARGLYTFDKASAAYVVISNTFSQLSSLGALTNYGALSTFAGRVSIADNGTQIMIVDGVYGYIFDTGTLAFTKITDPDFPLNPTTVTFLGGRFVISVASTGRFYASDLYNGLSWDALNFANAETNPDSIVSVWSSNGQLILLGDRSMEFWGNSGTLDFPFSLIQGTATEWGLAARWSIAKFDNSFACLVKNRMGQVMVAEIAGYLPKKISTPDVDAIINSYDQVGDASAYSYMLGGHNMYVISFPSAGYTWLYDGSTGMWSVLKSQGITRHLADFGISFLTNTIVADYSTGKLYKLNPQTYTDNGAQIESEIVSETITSPDLERFTVNNLRLDMAVGSGTSAVQTPQIGLSVSRDNGETWGAEMLKNVGALGNYSNLVEWHRFGTARNFVFKLRMTDPVGFTLVGANINTAA